MKTGATLLPVMMNMQEKQNSTLSKEIRAFFSEDRHAFGSAERLVGLLERFPQKTNGKVYYLIAGSWAVEFVSGKRLNHEDIDVILLDDVPRYLDDAVSSEEHCDGMMPLHLPYFLSSSSVLLCENVRGSGKVWVPNLYLQTCLKLLGELDVALSERALQQLETLFSCYREEDWSAVEKEMQFIYLQCLPSDLDTRALARDTVQAIREYRNGKKETAQASCRKIHHTINYSLRKAFALLQP